jgi:hypothetical protein
MLGNYDKRPTFFSQQKIWTGEDECMSDDTRRLVEELTVDRINEIVQTTGGHIARVIELVGYGREADLPFPRRLTELAYLKGIVICDDEQFRNLLIAVYSTLDDVLLPDDDYSVMVEYRALLKTVKELREAGNSATDLATRFTHPRVARAVEIQKAMTQAMHARMAQVNQLLKRS